MMEKRIRVLLTKPTHDCHDRGVRYLARRLRDAGFEVIFTNFLLAEEVVNTAVQEDVAIIGVSISSGGHMAVFEDLMEGLRDAQVSNVLVIGGGVIPNVDARELEQWGVRKVFGPGSSAESLMTFIRENAIAS